MDRKDPRTKKSLLLKLMCRFAENYHEEISKHPELFVLPPSTLEVIRVKQFKPSTGDKFLFGKIIDEYLRIGESRGMNPYFTAFRLFTEDYLWEYSYCGSQE